MEVFAPLTVFFDAISEDARISTTHVSLYMSLLQQWNIKGGVNPFSIDRDIVMKTAKINARFTYHKCMNHLQEYGYIKYLPSSNSFRQSIIYLKGIERILSDGKQSSGAHIDTL